MKFIQLLEEKRTEILRQSTDALARAQLTHYDDAGAAQLWERLQVAYDLMVQCVKERNLAPIHDYAKRVAQERFASGYDLHEIQTALNVLEESVWKHIIKECPPSELAEALGLTSTVFGAGKDMLARQYVSLASQTKPRSLNLLELFKGTDGLQEDISLSDLD